MARAGFFTRVLSEAASRIDRGVLTGMERRMRATAPRRAEMYDARQRLIDLAARYAAGVAQPERFFPEPEPVGDDEVRETPVAAGVVDLAFPSTYRPHLAEQNDEHARLVENLTVHARMYRIGHGRPALVCLHGWGGGAYWLEERAFVVSYWQRHGYDVVLAQLPFHGRRLPAGRDRGSLFPSANVVRTNEAFGQAVSDLRALRGLLERRGAPSVGVMGMSLGGYTTALWASIDERLAFAVPWIPAVDMADLMWRHGDDSPARRRAVAAGVDRELLREVFAVHAPTTRPPKLPRERLMIVAGKGDLICPPDQAERLWRHWGECAIHWFPGGHLAQVGRADALRAVRRFVSSLREASESPAPGAAASRATAASRPEEPG